MYRYIIFYYAIYMLYKHIKYVNSNKKSLYNSSAKNITLTYYFT